MKEPSELHGPGIKQQMVSQQHNERLQWEGSIYRTTTAQMAKGN
jgi:hypothetical protein